LTGLKKRKSRKRIKMIETNHQAKVDRKLGDEWTDWDGNIDPSELEIDEGLGVFFTLAASIVLIFIALPSLGWYLIKPRIELLSPLVSNLIEWAVMLLTVILIGLLLVQSISLMKRRRSLIPYRWMVKLILSLLPKTVWLGGRFGISKDRVGNSFIKVHNFMTKIYTSKLNSERLLILLPRCLKRDSRTQIESRINEKDFKIVTATGGEEARKAIRLYQPSFILAIACERDLISGIKDIAEKIPVLALPNRRPEGPCKNTHAQIGDVEEALRFIAEQKGHN